MPLAAYCRDGNQVAQVTPSPRPHEDSPPPQPDRWQQSVILARAWEAALEAAPTPHTRKVILRAAMVMSPDAGGVFSVLARLCRFGLGHHGDGRQFVSWIHEYDFASAVDFLLATPTLAGAVNVCSPQPLPNREFIHTLHHTLGSRLSIPVPVGLLELGAFALRTETELLLKSRRVVPTRLQQEGFVFRFPAWNSACAELLSRRSR